MTIPLAGKLLRNLAACIVCATVTVASFAQSPPAETDWRKAKEKDGITTYLRVVPGSKYRAVRGEATLPLSAARLVAVINDAPACSEWADLCKNSYVHQQVSNSEAYIYTLNDMPWPVKDRDVIAHLRWSKSANGTITMRSDAAEGVIERKPGAVRIQQATAMWKFTPLANGHTQTEFEIHLDPNGAIPGWLLNRLVVNSPFTTFNSLAKQAAKEKYNNATLPF